jgi:hypothetical protein
MSRTLVTVSGGSNNLTVGIPAQGGILLEQATGDNNKVSVAIPGPAGQTGPAGGEEEMLDTEVDQSVPGVVYVGQAQPGTMSSSPLWRIKRITESGSSTSVDWASGSSDFIHIWNNRLSLTYGP